MTQLSFFALSLILLMAPPAVFADGDEIELKDGSSLKGDIIAKNAVQVYLSTKDKGVIKVDLSDIRKIHFGPVPPEQKPQMPDEIK
jgi:hypothetical protein